MAPVDNPQGLDWSVETITITSDGPIDVAIPVPISERGTSLDDWEAAGAGTIMDTEHGAALVISGHQEIILCVANGPAADVYGEAYLDRTWSTEGFWARSETHGNVTVVYEATSNFCGSESNYVLSRVGWDSTRPQSVSWCD